MKKILLFTAITLVFVSCKNETKITDSEVEEVKQEIAYASFGMEINDADALTSERMMEHYKGLKAGDTVNAKMKGKRLNVVRCAYGTRTLSNLATVKHSGNDWYMETLAALALAWHQAG